MSPNSIDVNGIEIYENEINLLTDEYINTLPQPDMIYKNASVFNGLLTYIYNHLFRPNKNDRVLHNTRSNLDLSDTELLDSIFQCYSNLCNRYGKTRTLSRYCLFIGISEETLYTWKRGEYRKTNEKSNYTHSELVQKWYEECKTDTVLKAVEESSIGAIFGAKALYGLSDSTTIRVENTVGLPTQSLEQIAQQFKNAELPPPIEV